MFGSLQSDIPIELSYVTDYIGDVTKAAQYRERLHTILSDRSTPVETRVDRALELGAEYLDLQTGFVTRIDEGTQEIVQAVGDHDLIQPGEACPLEDAYCRRTIEIESPLAVQDAKASSAISGSAVEMFDLGAYIGARVVVKDETYGTICFADSETRRAEFSEQESYFVELAAMLVGQALERRSYERELEKREREVNTKQEVYRAVVDASFDLVFQIDPDGRFTHVSPTVEDLLGTPSDQYIGNPFTDMLPDEETVDIAEEVHQKVLSGETVERESFPLIHQTEGSVLVDIRVTPLYSGEVSPEDRTPADIVGLQGMARDARGRHRRQRLIRVLNRVLRHNLRNDMNVISSYAEVLQERLADEEATYARKISETTSRLIALSETARKLEENLDTPPDIGDVDIVPIATRAVTQIDERYPDASITLNTPESAVAKSGPRLEAALWELVDNAATHAGESPTVEVTVLVEGTSVVIRVTDDGPGLPEQDREVLVSGEETPLVHGSGLGLWLVYWVVESLDGQLNVPETDDETSIEVSLKRGIDS